MSEASAPETAVREGLVIIFDEPRRAPILHEIADDRGVFRDAFSAVDWPFDTSRTELCVLSFDGKTLSHVALAEAGRRAVTAKRGVTFSHVIACPPLPLFTLAMHLDFPLEKIAIRASTPQGQRVEGETWAAFFRQVQRLAPDMARALVELDDVRRTRRKETPDDAYEIFTLEADAIGTALDLAGMDRATVLRTAAPPRPDAALHPFIQTLDPRQQQPHATFDEVSALAHDGRVSAMWVEQMSGLSLCGTASFAKGERLLRVYNVNNKLLETSLGVDLLYHHVARQSFVLIQYKMMRQGAGDASPSYRIGDRMEEQLKRMDNWAAQLSGSAARRLTAEAFYWKICAPTLRAPRSPELVKGWYFSRPWMRELISTPDARGPLGGRRIVEDLAREGMSNTLFTELVQGGFIGSADVGSEALRMFVEAETANGRSVIVGVEGELGPPPRK